MKIRIVKHDCADGVDTAGLQSLAFINGDAGFVLTEDTDVP